jgi:hypothetical protein
MILTIGAYEVKVRAQEAIDVPASKTWYGFYDTETKEIGLKIDQTPWEQGATLIHEIIHAVWDTCNFPKRMSEEAVCTKLSCALATILVDNPRLMSALAGAIYHEIPIVKEIK